MSDSRSVCTSLVKASGEDASRESMESSIFFLLELVFCHILVKETERQMLVKGGLFNITQESCFQHRRYNREGSGSRMCSLTVRELAFPQAVTRSRMDGQIGRHRPVFRAV